MRPLFRLTRGVGPRGGPSQLARRPVLSNQAHEEPDRPAAPDHEPAETDAGDLGGPEDEIRVPRSEEELHTTIRRREAGAVRVRKNVRTDREEFRVPRKREEVEIERVPAEGEAREVPEGIEIGEGEEVVVPVYEEEIVITKRVVLKEEIRLRKEVVEEEEIIEEDVRREEVEIDDQTVRGGSSNAFRRPE